MVKVAVSILDPNYLKLIPLINKTRADYIHIDVMDGLFVKEQAFRLTEIKTIADKTKKPLDIHLMVKDLNYYVDYLISLKPAIITIHYEALIDLTIINKIKSNGIKLGMAVNPKTNIDVVFPLLKQLDLVLIMSVEPGYSGQEFITSTLTKIKVLKAYLINNNLKTLIGVDGGINYENAVACLKQGVDLIVANTFIIKSNNMEERILLLKNMNKEKGNG